VALIPPSFLDTVVAIGVGSAADRRWIGTGFLYGDLVPGAADPDQRRYQLWLITNKHVLQGLKTVSIRFNAAPGAPAKDYEVTLIARNGKPRWIGHAKPETDVAAIFLNAGVLDKDARRYAFFRSDHHVAGKARLQSNEITEGDRIFVLGFPIGLVTADRQYVICRGGVLARIRDYLDGHASDFLVDAPIFPGNSGGPVVLCPSLTAISGTKAVTRADLIGIVKSYVPFIDVAISQQTRRPRITFEENSGLAAIEPLDAIAETVALAARRIAGRAAYAKYVRNKKAKSVGPQPASGGNSG